jgi:hypothetical protein
MPWRGSQILVSEDEQAVLRRAKRDGAVYADLYSNGDFDEAGFMLFGRLEVMCLKGLLRFVERCGDAERAPGQVRMVFALDEAGRLAAA